MFLELSWKLSLHRGWLKMTKSMIMYPGEIDVPTTKKHRPRCKAYCMPINNVAAKRHACLLSCYARYRKDTQNK